MKGGIAAAIIAIALAGCGTQSTSLSASPQTLPAASARNVLSTSVLNPKVLAHIETSSGKRLAPHSLDRLAKGTETMLISDAYANQVYVFTYPTGKYAGTLPQPKEGFSEVQGLCSDTNGNVFAANTSNSTIDEYTNGAFVKALSDPGMYPVGCAVDPKSNTLAVSNIISTSGGQGGISLYANASGAPQQLSDPYMYEVNFISYYGKTGNLYFSGDDTSFYPAMSSYIRGVFKPFVIQGVTLGFAGSVAYAAKTKSLVIGDQDSFYGPVFYEVKQNGKVIGKVVLSCDSGGSGGSGFCDVVQAAVKGDNLLAPDASSVGAALFSYPSGQLKKKLTGAFEQPIGSAFSFVK